MSKQKEDKFFEEILERNKHKIFRICTIYAVPPIEPQDLFQEVIFQIWKSLDSFNSNASMDTWVYRICLNVCLRSKMKLDKSYSTMVRLESIHVTPLENETDTFEQEKLNYLKECIASLNETDTSLIVLYLDDLSYKEIAAITGLSENDDVTPIQSIRFCFVLVCNST